MDMVEYIQDNGFNLDDTHTICELIEVGSNVYEKLQEGSIIGCLKDITPSEENFENFVHWVHICIELFKECKEKNINLVRGEFEKVGNDLTSILTEKLFESNHLVEMEKV